MHGPIALVRYTINAFHLHADAMNTQAHEANGASPYELAFGQKPRSVLFLNTTASGVILEEDLIDEGVHFGTGIVERLTKGAGDDITTDGTAEDAEGILVEMQKPGGSTTGAESVQDALLGSTLSFDVVGREQFVQVLHSGGDHWLKLSAIGCSYSTVKMVDSLFTHVPKKTMDQIFNLLVSSEPTITLQLMTTDSQQK